MSLVVYLFIDLQFIIVPKFCLFVLLARSLADTDSTGGFIWFLYIQLFRKLRLFRENRFRKKLANVITFRIDFHPLSPSFGITLRIDLFIDVAGKWLHMGRVCVPSHPPAGDFLATFTRHLLVTPWLTFGALLAPFSSLLVPFGLFSFTSGDHRLTFGAHGFTFSIGARRPSNI